jgi:hypothetical protein
MKTGRPPLLSTLAGLHRCTVCKQLKPLSEFYRERRRPDGYGYRCKPCHSATVSAKYHERLERSRKLRRERYHRNRESERASNARSRKKNGHKWLATRRARHTANPAANMWSVARARAKREGLEFDLILSDVAIPDRCPVFGFPLVIGQGRPSKASPSLHRIDNSKGYTRGNVVVVSYKANTMKNDATLEQLRQLVAFYEKFE